MPLGELCALEHSTLKVPYEMLNKKFRVAQKAIDREVAHVNDAANQLEKALAHDVVVRVNDVDGLVSSLIEKLRGLKRKASEVVADETESAVLLKKRIDHLKIFADGHASDVTLQQWRQTRVERYMVDYLLRAGYYETAQKFAAGIGIDYLTNLSVFYAAKEVEESLARRELAKCLEWCYENRSKLRRTNSSLELRVREQEFIELIRRDQRMEAVRYARKYFVGADSEQWPELARVMGMLAFGAGTDVQQYRELLSASRWDLLIDEFREENFRLYQLNTQSVFSACLQCGLASMKTPKCFSSNMTKMVTTEAPMGHPRSADCPVCVPEAKLLAASLPYAHASQSRLVCSHSGEAINEHNPPFVLPNGMVYGQNTLYVIAAQNGGRVVCPRTGAVYTLKEAERVFVM